MQTTPELERLHSLKTLPQLIAYLRDDLDWPVNQDAIEDEVTFDYAPEELGFDTATAVHIKEIKQLRPLDSRQPWGVFWVNFEKKRLPVVMLRRILGHLVLKKRATANKASQRAWQLNDLLFISAYGEESDRAITFAHFSQPADSPGDLPILKVLGWDDGDTVLHLVDAHKTLTEKLRWPPKTASLEEWRSQWASAFTLRHREVITTTDKLVEELARLADATRRRARTILAKESERGPLRRLYAAFKTALIHDLTEDDFADVIAQTISYGLLIARFSRSAISAQNLVDMVPATNPFLRELLQTFLALAGRQSAFDFDELGIQDVVEVLNRSNADAVKADFGNRTKGEDPVIHFYEHFLAAYDKKKKVQRGVFFTPQPVVSYIVRSVYELLQKEFGIEDGLASTETWADLLKRTPGLKLPKIRVPKAGKAEGEEVELSPEEFFVMILDIATGTGTFSVEAIEVIFQHLQAKWAKHGLQGMPIIRHSALRLPQFKDYWNAYVPAALLPRLYGYELMMAPYTIAHMKLALKFSEINARLGQSDTLFNFAGRANIYLTNTLEPPSGFQTHEFADFFPALAHEAAAVNTVKRAKRFTVVIGNPPYAGHSANKGEWISRILKDYYFVDGKPLGEKNPKWLQDDYVKFLRIAQQCIAQSGIGLLGFITNHSYIDNPTFRGMRQSLHSIFTELLVLDLHGNSKKKEQCPDGSADENVFDIQQGVAVVIGSRTPRGSQEIGHQNLYGLRSFKYENLARQSCQSAKWSRFAVAAPFYLFHPQNSDLRAEYNSFPRITEVMPVNVLGFQTHRDNFAVDFDDRTLSQRMGEFRASSMSDAEVKKAYEISDNRDWNVHDARSKIRSDPAWKNHLIRCSYRPLDFRYCYFSTVAMDYPRRELLDHVAGKKNLCLNTNRIVMTTAWRHAVVSNSPAASVYCDLKDGSNVFPLWLYPDHDGLSISETRRPNLCSTFLRVLGERFQPTVKGENTIPITIEPEHVFHYIYAMFYSQGYRSRYAEFLKIDFPRLPLTGSIELFRALAKLGGEIVSLHLMESPKLEKPLTEFRGSRNPEVEKASWSQETVWLDKAQTTGFTGVPEAVWNFHIGGYQVCEKWLKDRKGRTLSAEDIAHYHKIVVALSETIRFMSEIDAVIESHGGWPIK